jgi:hypothetical protein
MRSAPPGAGRLGNLRQGPQRYVNCRRVPEQFGNFGIKDKQRLSSYGAVRCISRGLTLCPDCEARRPEDDMPKVTKRLSSSE